MVSSETYYIELCQNGLEASFKIDLGVCNDIPGDVMRCDGEVWAKRDYALSESLQLACQQPVLEWDLSFINKVYLRVFELLLPR